VPDVWDEGGAGWGVGSGVLKGVKVVPSQGDLPSAPWTGEEGNVLLKGDVGGWALTQSVPIQEEPARPDGIVPNQDTGFGDRAQLASILTPLVLVE